MAWCKYGSQNDALFIQIIITVPWSYGSMVLWFYGSTVRAHHVMGGCFSLCVTCAHKSALKSLLVFE